MKFCKLLLRDVPKKGDTFQWRLIIDNEEDLAIHHHNEAYAYYNALIGLAKQSDAGELRTDHLGGAETRQIALARLLRCKQETLKEGEKAYPIITPSYKLKRVFSLYDGVIIGFLVGLSWFISGYIGAESIEKEIQVQEIGRAHV